MTSRLNDLISSLSDNLSSPAFAAPYLPGAVILIGLGFFVDYSLHHFKRNGFKTNCFGLWC